MRPIYLVSKTPFEGVVHVPILTITFFTPEIDFTRYQGLILTSKQSILALEPYCVPWDKLPCVCVSEGTAEAARKAGASELYVGDGYGRSIPELMVREGLSGRWLYLRPKVIASNWVEKVDSEIRIDETIVYETTCNDQVDTVIEDNGVLIFTSPSAVECFSHHFTLLSTHTVVAIGKTTKDALGDFKEVHISPDTSIASAVEYAQKIAELSSTF